MPNDNTRLYSLLNRMTATIVVVWLGIIAGSLFWNLHLVKEQTRLIALNVAAAYFDKDLAFRLWGARHGGVYVPVTGESPPNPYLAHVPERDIVTPSGKKLTLVNPAYMIRQMMAEFSELTGASGHLTSLKLLNPVNRPDPWEEKILKQFERGVKEATTFAEIDGRPYLRLMRPFITRKPCLKCHAHQGYKVGDVRGGTSMSIPMEPYLATEKNLRAGMILTHLLILAFGLLTIFIGYWRIQRNITRHVVLKEELQSQNKFIHSIIESLTHPFFVFDADTYRVELANSAALGGRPLSDQTCYSMCHGLNEPCGGKDHPCPNSILKKERKAVTLEHVHVDENGEKRQFEIQCYPLVDENGRVSKIIEYAVDITERRLAEEESKRLHAQLQQARKMEAIGKLSGGVAHDFNNYLTAILGYCELAANRLEPDHPVRKYLDIVNATGKKATALTRQLLAFSRKQVLQIQPVCLDHLIVEMSKMLCRLLGEDITVEHRLNTESLTIKADPSQLEQVIMNLAVNARDAMPDGGVLVFETEKVSFEADAVRHLHPEMPPGDYLLFSVSDNGEGMNEAVRAKLFEPFFTTREIGKGTGLGLATVYGIVKQHKSYIYVYSEPGTGTTFKIYFPLAAETAPGPVPGQGTAEPAMPRGSENIMTLDDDGSIVDFISEALTSLGYSVTGMDRPEAALEYLRKNPGATDLLITDVIMPGMNGREVAAEARKLRPDLPVLFMSGYTDNIIARQGVLEEGVDFIQKPVKPSVLAKQVREMLDARADKD